MSIDTPEHWSGETRRYANVVMRLPASREHDGRIEEGLLAIAVELAELRKVLAPTEITMVSTQPPGSYVDGIEAAVEGMRISAGVPADLLPQEHETSGFAFHRAMPELQRTAYDRAAIITGHANIKLVGWYCPGGHEVDQHDSTPGFTKTTQPNLRFEDPCEYAVPVYVLVK